MFSFSTENELPAACSLSSVSNTLRDPKNATISEVTFMTEINSNIEGNNEFNHTADEPVLDNGIFTTQMSIEFHQIRLKIVLFHFSIVSALSIY